MPTPTPSVGAIAFRFASVTFTVTKPPSSFVIATPVTSGAVPESPDTSAKEPLFAANAVPAKTRAHAPTTTSARRVDPFIRARLAQNPTDVTRRIPPTPRRRRRLARAPRVPRAAEELPPRRGPPRERIARFLQLHRAALADGGTACGARRLGLARDAHLPARAVCRLPGRPRIRRRPARAARAASGACARIRLRGGESTR